jgi:hypothetical protein
MECQNVNVGREITAQLIPMGRFLAMTHSAKLNFLTKPVAAAETVEPPTKVIPVGLTLGRPGVSTTKILLA